LRIRFPFRKRLSAGNPAQNGTLNGSLLPDSGSESKTFFTNIEQF
jgi:hypothetical protein